jgi:very-short-patch-repair endonuclease/phosphoribosyl-AMP cyclohydrolase
MTKFTCNDCNREFDTLKGLQNHNSRTHKISSAQTYVNVNLNGIWPICKCRCGQQLNYFSTFGFGEYIRGHKARMTGGFYTKEGIEKSSNTRREQFASGTRKQWNKGVAKTEEQMTACIEAARTPERRKKISEKLTGKKKSPEHVAKIQADRKKYWSDREHRLQQRDRRMQYIIANGLGYSSNLEKVFKEILDGIGVNYIEQFYVQEIKALYDFKIKGRKVLIEVDGDYWHCNPNIEKFKTPTQQWHFDNLERDKLKNQWAEDNGYQLIRFWEHDICNNRLDVVSKLLEICKT